MMVSRPQPCTMIQKSDKQIHRLGGRALRRGIDTVSVIWLLFLRSNRHLHLMAGGPKASAHVVAQILVINYREIIVNTFFV